MGIQHELANRIVTLQRRDISDDAVKKIQYLLLDAIGIACYVSGETPWGKILSTYASNQKLDEGATIIGSGAQAQVASAAFINGSNMLGCEMEDTLTSAYLHLGPPTLATALALSEQYSLNGESVVTAVYGAYQITAPLGERYGKQMLLKGAHPTAHFGCIAAAAAAGKLLNLTVKEMENALGIAIMLSSGYMQAINEGSMTRRLYGGAPAQTGIAAVELARLGFDGPHRALEGEGGLLRTLFEDADIDLDDIAAGPDRQEQVLKASFKRHACCHAFHASIDILEALQDKLQFEVTSVTKIVADIKLISYAHANQKPTNAASAQYSLPYCLATQLVQGRVGPREFSPACIKDPKTLRLAQLVETRFPEDLQSERAFPGRVTVYFKDGTSVSESRMAAKGDVCNDDTYRTVIQKFTDMTNPVLTQKDQAHIIKQCMNLDTLSNSRAIFPTP
jgi:2-methylcitrate dehydratase PrpD